jgi:hypothetical protein
MADLPIAAVVRIAKKNGAERVGSDAAAALVVKAEAYIAELTKEPTGLPSTRDARRSKQKTSSSRSSPRNPTDLSSLYRGLLAPYQISVLCVFRWTVSCLLIRLSGATRDAPSGSNA